MLRKNYLLKKRDKYFVVREILMPLYFVGILVLSTISLKNQQVDPILVDWGTMGGTEPQMNYPLTRGATNGDLFKAVMGLTPGPIYDNPPSKEYKRFQGKKDSDLTIAVAPCTDGDTSDVSGVLAKAKASFATSSAAFTFKCFPSASAMQAAAVSSPSTFLAGIAYETTALSFPVSYTLYVNASDMQGLGVKNFAIQNIGPFESSWSWMKSGYFTFQRLFEQSVLQQKGGDIFIDPTIQEVPWDAYTTNLKAQEITNLIGIYLILVFSFVLRGNLAQIVEDKKKKIRIGLKMIGLTDDVYWCSWAITMMFTYSIIGVLLAVLLHIGQVLPNTDLGILILYFTIFSLDLSFLCIAMSAFFQNPEIAGVGSMVAFILMEIPGDIISTMDGATPLLKSLISLLPPAAFTMGLKTINLSEVGGEGTQWANIAQASFTSTNFSVASSMLMMLINIPLYIFLGWYLNNIVSQEWGVARPWYFIFQSSYWAALPAVVESRSKSVANELTHEVTDIEPVPSSMDAKIGVSVSGLRKEFPPKSAGDKHVTAVDSLTIKAYEGQVFCLLGHNGAGKSTTVSMLTGLYPPTSGDATLYGHSIVTSLEDVQREIGVCPQHDILFPTLTVREHLELYGAVMGVEPAKLPTLIEHYVNAVGLMPKIDTASSSLSGGMKRKLSVTIALIGDPKVGVVCSATLLYTHYTLLPHR
jgi:ABC-type lipoprotein export system ATPase subunit